jgi:hypothetical protein
MEAIIGLYAKFTPGLRLTTRGIYGIFIYIGLLMAFMHGYVVRKLVKFVPEAVLVVVGTAAQALALAIMPMIPSVACILFSMALLAFGQGVCVPALLAVVSQATDPSNQGRVMGVTQSASSLARILGPMAGMGVVYLGAYLEGAPTPQLAGLKAAATDAGYGGLRWPFWLGAIGMVAAMAMAMVVRRRLIERPLEGTIEVSVPADAP